MGQQPMTLNQMMEAYQQLTADFQAKRMDQASYSAALTRLKAIDSGKTLVVLHAARRLCVV